MNRKEMDKQEQLILVDALDNEIGTGEKMEVHKAGHLHRAFSIFILDGDRVLLQKRNPGKYHSGGLWTNTCCSHPRKYEELGEAVHRRLLEEVGFDTELSEIGKFIYRAVFENGLTEYEYDHVFIGGYNGETIVPNEDEIAELKWINVDELAAELTLHPECYTAWFLTAAPMVLRYIKEQN